MNLNRHGLPLIADGPLFGHVAPLLEIQHSIPADVQLRFRTVKSWHYPSETLYKLQGGRCFYCGKHIGDEEYNADRPKGYRKKHFMPKAKGFALWGNKVLCCRSCAVRTADEYPTEQQKRDFRKLYSVGRFEAVTKGEV